MRRIVVLALLIVLSVEVFVSLYACSSSQSLTGINVETYSSEYPLNFIDHLPFIINETDVYYIVKDLTVNGDGITILANNTVLIGQGHTITGNGTGKGIDMKSNYSVVTNLHVKNFDWGINLAVNGQCDNVIYGNSISNNARGIRLVNLDTNHNRIHHNRIFDNTYGLVISQTYNNYIYDNFFNNSNNAWTAYTMNHWNVPKTLGINIIGGAYVGGNYWDDYIGEDSDGDGLGETPHTITGYGDDYDDLPLVDIIPPKYSNPAFRTFSTSCTLNITWKDNAQLDKAILELDGINYTDVEKLHESLDFNEYYHVEHKITYSKSFSNLSLGTHYYRWYANDTRNHWNSTQLLTFNVTAIPQINKVEISPILEVKANITCEGFTNITEIIDYTKLHFKIDDNWYTMNMTYNPQTTLYHALTPAYTELANKTIRYYIEATDKNGNTITSEEYAYTTPDWIKVDINRDGKVDMKDIGTAARNFGQPH